MNPKRFPQYLSLPYQVLWFDADDLVILMTVLVFSLAYGKWFLFTTAPIPLFYMRVKKKYPRGFFKHCLYFIGILPMKGYPIFFEDKFIE